MADGKGEEQMSAGSDIPPVQPTKTPMFQASNANRYERQALIRKIRETYGTPLISYVSGNAASIERDDTIFLVDLLHNLRRGDPLDFMIQTSGGDIDAAEKLISLVKTCVGKARLRVIVPDYAKSSGTLMTLGADAVVMSDTSELGPIDPQVVMRDSNGNAISHSVQNYLDAYNDHTAALRNNPSDIGARIMLGKLDPATVKLFDSVRGRARSLAEEQLRTGMFRSTAGNVTAVADKLLDTKAFRTHGQMIGWQAASDIGLNVDRLEQSSEQWKAYWLLYCLQRLAVKDSEKLFESEYASLAT